MAKQQHECDAMGNCREAGSCNMIKTAAYVERDLQ